jgi:hypothetical protein
LFFRPYLSPSDFALPSSVGNTTFPQVFHRGYIESWNLTVQRDVGAGFNVQAAYVGSRGIRQTVNQNINAAGPGGGNTGRALYSKFQRISNVTYHTPFDTTTYDGLQTQMTRRVGSSLLGIAYTFSKSITWGDDTDSGLTWNWVPMLQRNRALAGFDRTHNLQFYGNYDVPLGRKYRIANQGVSAAILGGWKVNWILSRMSGTPFTVVTSGTSVNAPGNTQTADQVKSEAQILGGHGVGSPYFDPLAFRAVTDVRFGNVGRNSVRGPGVFNLDASVFREFRIKERAGFEVRMEMFGVTNTPQFANPGATASNMTLNASGGVQALNGFGEITSATGERQIRFAAKFTF